LEGEDGGDEMNGGLEAGVGFVIAGGDTAELFDLLEEILDQVAPGRFPASLRQAGRLG